MPEYHAADRLSPARLTNWNDLPQERLRRDVARAGCGGADMLCQLAWIEPGAEKRPHWHDFEQLVIVIARECLFHLTALHIAVARVASCASRLTRSISWKSFEISRSLRSTFLPQCVRTMPIG